MTGGGLEVEASAVDFGAMMGERYRVELMLNRVTAMVEPGV
jgi:hypothetical protein